MVACSANSMPQSTAKFHLPSELHVLSSKLHPRRAGPLSPNSPGQAAGGSHDEPMRPCDLTRIASDGVAEH